MPQSPRPPVFVCAHQPGALAELRRALAGGGLLAAGHLLGAAGLDAPPDCSLVVLDGTGAPAEALQACARLRAHFDEGFVPIVFVADVTGPAGRQAVFEAGADACLARPLAPGELLAQVVALLRVKESHDRLAEKATE